MRRAILIFLLLFYFFQSHASHLLGGEITARLFGGNDCVVTLTIYCDTLGKPMAKIVNLNVSDDAGTILFTFSPHYNSILSGILASDYTRGIEIYTFVDTITLPGQGRYSISYHECSKGQEAKSTPGVSFKGMTLKTIITNNTIANSTPVFLAPPVFFVQINTPWTYNPLPYDPDGDSLHWILEAPFSDNMSSVTDYALPLADSTGSFILDAVTGTIQWTPHTPGNFISCMLVEEFRNGIKIGEIKRNMQIIVVDDTSQCAKITNFYSIPINSQGYPYIEITANQVYQLTLNAMVPNSNGTIDITSYGEPYLFTQDDATFSTTTFMKTKNAITGNFTWKPSVAMARDNPYLVMFRTSNNYFHSDYTIMFKVKVSTEIIDNSIFAIGNIYPNPVHSMIFLPVSLDIEAKISMHILDILGNPVWTMPDLFFDSGKHLLSVAISLPNGQYIAQTLKNGVVCKTQKIIVAK